jgi:hypothetical protein
MFLISRSWSRYLCTVLSLRTPQISTAVGYYQVLNCSYVHGHFYMYFLH